MAAEQASETTVALTVAGSDSGGGAGIQADLKTFAALGVFGTSAITCLTAQNPGGVSGIVALAPAFVRQQLEQVLGYFRVRAVKTGMLYNAAIIGEVARTLAPLRSTPLVVDPVMVATSGALLLQKEAVAALQAELLPRATLVTPNLDEVGVLLGCRPRGPQDMAEAGRTLVSRYGNHWLIKGGHLEDPAEVEDLLVGPDGSTRSFRHRRVADINTHGSGCTLASAITAHLAKGAEVPAAVEDGLTYLTNALLRPVLLSGERFIGH